METRTAKITAEIDDPNNVGQTLSTTLNIEYDESVNDGRTVIIFKIVNGGPILRPKRTSSGG